MQELDCVKLIKPFKELKVGTKGCIVLKYTENDFEVEFFDENNEKVLGLVDLTRICEECTNLMDNKIGSTSKKEKN